MKQRCLELWYKGHPIYWLLAPIAWCYGFIMLLRRFCYRVGIKKTTRFSAPIIIVGNICAGGSGKTPLVIALVELLSKAGYKPGVVSRGYGGHYDGSPTLVDEQATAFEVGDEPRLIANRINRPVVVATKRVAAVEYLLANTDSDIVISDDGLQHYALARDIEIVVMDSQRRLLDAKLLPAGPLREPVSRLKEVDFIVINGNAEPDEICMQLQVNKLYQLNNPHNKLALTKLSGQHVHAIAGIGNPSRFFQTLREQQINVIDHPFSDHFKYNSEDICFNDELLVLMTEKDAVKCVKFANQQHWVLPVCAKLDASFEQKVLNKLTFIK